MINKIKHIFSVIILLVGVNAYAQNTTNSPYSQFGLGDIQPALIPQFRGMGGIAMGVRQPGGYLNINPANPASYSAISLTAFDIGGKVDFRTLSKSDVSQKAINGTLSHLLIAVPVNPKSALSFGLLPYSDLGYQSRNHTILDGEKVDHVFSGDGGLAKAYLGYGYKLNKHLSLGLNMSYVFGNLIIKQSAEFIEDPTALSSRTQNEKSIGGLNLQYGAQYVVNPEAKTRLTIGYSGTASSKLNSSGSTTTFRYRYDAATKAESEPIDTIYSNPSSKSKLTVPQTHTLGFALDKANSWLIGADFTYTQWSKFSDGGAGTDLQDSYGVALGGQITPDITAVSNYFKLIEYSLGLKYDKTYIKVGDQNINQYALTAGLGFPLPSNRYTFYKINFSAEMGKRGTLKNNLVKENYLNIHLGFTLNDKWFIKPKYD